MATAADNDEDDLDYVDAWPMRMQNLRLFLKTSIRPQTDLSMNFAWFRVIFACVCDTDAQQVSSYGRPYGPRPHTVHTVNHMATLKTVWAIPAS